MGNSTPKAAPAQKAAKVTVDLAAIKSRIRAIQSGDVSAEGVGVDLTVLTGDHLKDILKQFKKPSSGSKGALLERVKALCVASTTDNPGPQAPVQADASPLTPSELEEVEEGVRVFTQLRDDRGLSITAVRAGFEPLRNYPKPVCRRTLPTAQVHP